MFVTRRYVLLRTLRWHSTASPASTTGDMQHPLIKSERWRAIRTAKPLSHFLTDNYKRTHDYLRISVTERCNLRCTYCMPEEGVELQHESKILTTEEIIKIAKIFVAQGVKKIRLTGGEPTVRKDIVDIVARLNQIAGLQELCITSNGIALHRKLPQLAKNGLTSLNLSLDTLIDGKFQLITRRNGLSMVLKSLEAALKLGIPKVKVNCVIVKGLNDDEILNFLNLCKHYPVEVRFIEYMPFDGNKWELEKVISFQEIINIIRKEYPEIQSITHKYGETSKVFKIPNFQGQIGFISSMTDDFCSDCTRLRITSDGNLKVCLFGNDEVSIRDLLRAKKSEDEILQVIGKAVKSKKEKHAGLDELSSLKNRPMILIGGSHWAPTHSLSSFGQARFYSTNSNAQKLTHVNEKGEANMVDIGSKTVTKRQANAHGFIKFSNPIPIHQIKCNMNKKGDVLSIARISGILAIKKTFDLIILCHPLALTKAEVLIEIVDQQTIKVESIVKCEGKTGVEMEALVGVNVALLNIYDMCKAVDKHMIIEDVKVVHKTGGKSDFSLITET